jgi:hypothetical protein
MRGGHCCVRHWVQVQSQHSMRLPAMCPAHHLLDSDDLPPCARLHTVGTLQLPTNTTAAPADGSAGSEPISMRRHLLQGAEQACCMFLNLRWSSYTKAVTKPPAAYAKKYTPGTCKCVNKKSLTLPPARRPPPPGPPAKRPPPPNTKRPPPPVKRPPPPKGAAPVKRPPPPKGAAPVKRPPPPKKAGG